MNFSRRRPRQRSERWEREDSAPRLKDIVPSLTDLKLELKEERDGVSMGNASVRHVIVASAAALFEFKCSGCNDASYDVTSLVLSGLQRKEPLFEGSRRCLGLQGDRPCERTLAFVAHAVYAEP